MKIGTRGLIIGLSFTILAMGLIRVGNPESPSQRTLRESSKTWDIAVIGDSRPHVGISPRTIARVLAENGHPDIRIYNFGEDGTDVLHHISLVRSGLLVRPEPPRMIIWATSPLQYSASRAQNRLERLHLSDIPDLWHAGAPLELIFDVGVGGLFPPWRHRPLIRKILMDYSEIAAIRTLPVQKSILRLTHIPEKPSRTYQKLDDGQEPFVILDWEDRFLRGQNSYQKDYQALKLSHWHFNLARRLLERTRQAGVQMIVLEMPISPWLRNDIADNSSHQIWRSRMSTLAAEQGAIFWNHAEALPDDDHSFGDPGHMSLQTAERYSQLLGKQIAAVLNRDTPR